MAGFVARIDNPAAGGGTRRFKSLRTLAVRRNTRARHRDLRASGGNAAHESTGNPKRDRAGHLRQFPSSLGLGIEMVGDTGYRIIDHYERRSVARRS